MSFRSKVNKLQRKMRPKVRYESFVLFGDEPVPPLPPGVEVGYILRIDISGRSDEAQAGGTGD